MKTPLFGTVLSIGVSTLLGLGVSAPAQAAKTMVFSFEGNPNTRSPPLAQTNISFNVLNPVFDNLVRFDIATPSIMPSLAESGAISDDGLVYTVKNWPGGVFHATDQSAPIRALTAKTLHLFRTVGLVE